MTNSIEELLREGFDRFTVDAKAAAGMVGRAQRRNRRRRVASMSAIAVGTALAAAAVAITATVAVQRSSPAPRVQTIAYVTSRAQHALAAMAQRNAVEEVRETARNGVFGFTVLNMAPSKERNQGGSAVLPGILGTVKAQRMTSWYYRKLMVQEGFSATGKPVFISSFGTVTSPTGKRVAAAYGAAYPARTRWLSPNIGRSAPLPKLTCANALPGASGSRLRATILKALSCQRFTLDGNQQVDGVNAIKLTMKPLPGNSVRETLWLDPSTYLPLRTSTAFLGPHGQVSLRVDDCRWLPPTPANLAALHATIHRASIPPRFRKLRSTDLPLTGFEPFGIPQS